MANWLNEATVDYFDVPDLIRPATTGCAIDWECTVYKYTNFYLGRTNMMHVLAEDGSRNGSIGWENKAETLPWQGYFRVKADDTIELAFDCYGRGKLKSAKLFKISEDMWEGFDYDGRQVRIKKVMRLRHCTVCEAWHPVPFDEEASGYELV